MKFALVVLLFLPLLSFGQNSIIEKQKVNVNSNELGFNVFSITSLTRGLDRTDRRMTTADFNYFSGIYYKFHFGKNAIRSSFDYFQKAIVYNSGNPNDPFEVSYYTAVGSKQSIKSSIGYEREFGSKKLRPYAFSDFVFGYSKSTGIETMFSCVINFQNKPFYEEVFEYGIDAGAGLKYQVNQHISLSCEFSANGFYSVFQDVQSGGGKFKEFGNRLNPLSRLGFAVSF